MDLEILLVVFNFLLALKLDDFSGDILLSLFQFVDVVVSFLESWFELQALVFEISQLVLQLVALLNFPLVLVKNFILQLDVLLHAQYPLLEFPQGVAVFVVGRWLSIELDAHLLLQLLHPREQIWVGILLVGNQLVVALYLNVLGLFQDVGAPWVEQNHSLLSFDELT